MLVLLVRHGPAGHADARRWPGDRERPLTGLGQKRARRAMRGVAALVPGLEAIWTSPLARAKQTAQLLARGYPAPPPVLEFEDLAPGGDALPVLRREAPRRTVAIVGHEPDLGMLAGHLLAHGGIALPLKKAGACAIEFEGVPGKGRGTLAWFLPPRVLRRLSKSRPSEDA